MKKRWSIPLTVAIYVAAVCLSYFFANQRHYWRQMELHSVLSEQHCLIESWGEL